MSCMCWLLGFERLGLGQGASELLLNPLILQISTSFLPKSLTGGQQTGDGECKWVCARAL